jgi:hypothetical protein
MGDAYGITQLTAGYTVFSPDDTTRGDGRDAVDIMSGVTQGSDAI